MQKQRLSRRIKVSWACIFMVYHQWKPVINVWRDHSVRELRCAAYDSHMFPENMELLLASTGTIGYWGQVLRYPQYACLWDVQLFKFIYSQIYPAESEQSVLEEVVQSASQSSWTRSMSQFLVWWLLESRLRSTSGIHCLQHFHPQNTS